MNERQKALAALNEAGIKYELEEHEPVYTVEGCVEAGLFDRCEICKNLFVCDDKGRSHYLVVVPGRKQISLKTLAERLGEKKIRFGSDKRLMKYLGIEPGHVSPFTIINDESGDVTVVLDSDLQKHDKLGFHPNDNAATCIITHADLLNFLSRRSNEVRTVTL